MAENPWTPVEPAPAPAANPWTAIPMDTGGMALDQPQAVTQAKGTMGEVSLDEAAHMIPLAGAATASMFTPVPEAMLLARFGPYAGRLIGLASRTLQAGAGGQAGSLVESGIQASRGRPDAPQSLGEALSRSTEAGTEYAKAQLAGEAAGGVITHGLVPAAKATVGGVLQVSRRMPGGSLASKLMDKVVTQESDTAANMALAEIAAPQRAETWKATAETLRTNMDRAIESKAADMYEMSKVLGAKLPNRLTDISQPTDTILKAFAEHDTARQPIGRLSQALPQNVMDVIDALKASKERIYDATVGGAEKAAKAQTERLLGPSSGAAIVPFERELQPIGSGKKATGKIYDAVPGTAVIEDITAAMDIRRKLSQVADKDLPKGNLQDAFRKAKYEMDDIISGKMSSGGPEARGWWEATTNFWNAKARIQEAAFYKQAASDPASLATLITDARDAARLKAVVKMTPNSEQAWQATKRQFMENLTTDPKTGALDVGMVGKNLSDYTPETIRTLFDNPAELAAVQRLKTTSDKLNDFLSRPGAQGAANNANFKDTLLQLGLGGGVGAALMPSHRAAVGLAVLAPATLVAIADNPVTTRAFEGALNLLEKGEAFAPAAKTLLGKALGTAAKKVMPQPSH